MICEKPLGRSADEAYETWQRVAAAGVKHMCAFNYRFVPAIRLAREMIAAGELGEIFHFRGSYLQEWIVDADFPMVWRLDKSVAGSGALGDLGAHVIDLARYLVGEIDAVSATTRTFIKDRGGAPVDVDDSVEALVDFEGGAVGIIEASRFCPGRKNHLTFEINGSKGSLSFDMERLNDSGTTASSSSAAADKGALPPSSPGAGRPAERSSERRHGRVNPVRPDECSTTPSTAPPAPLNEFADPYEVGAVHLARVADHDHAVHPVGERQRVGVGEHGGREHHDGGARVVGLGEQPGGGRGGQRAGDVAHPAPGDEVEGAGLARVDGQLESGGPAAVAQAGRSGPSRAGPPSAGRSRADSDGVRRSASTSSTSMPISAKDADRLTATAAAVSLEPRGATTSSRRRSANRLSWASRKATERYSSASRPPRLPLGEQRQRRAGSRRAGRAAASRARARRARAPPRRRSGPRGRRPAAPRRRAARARCRRRRPGRASSAGPGPEGAVGGTAGLMT